MTTKLTKDQKANYKHLRYMATPQARKTAVKFAIASARAAKKKK
jgi:hypothetical protein